MTQPPDRCQPGWQTTCVSVRVLYTCDNIINQSIAFHYIVSRPPEPSLPAVAGTTMAAQLSMVMQSAVLLMLLLAARTAQAAAPLKYQAALTGASMLLLPMSLHLPSPRSHGSGAPGSARHRLLTCIAISSESIVVTRSQVCRPGIT